MGRVQLGLECGLRVEVVVAREGQPGDEGEPREGHRRGGGVADAQPVVETAVPRSLGDDVRARFERAWVERARPESVHPGPDDPIVRDVSSQFVGPDQVQATFHQIKVLE